MKYCTSLNRLHLDWNNIDSDGALVLAEGLKHCTDLKRLSFCNNNIDKQCQYTVVELFKPVDCYL